MAADDDVVLYAMGDAFSDKVDASLKRLREHSDAARIDVPESRRFSGFDAYKGVIDSGVDVIILDDWGLSVLKDEERRDLLEIVEDRRGLRSTVVTSQLPVSKWHDTIGDPTIADSILDRLVHPAHRIELDGPSLRKTKKRSKS